MPWWRNNYRRRLELHTLIVLQTPSVGEVCEYPKVSSFLNSYLVMELVYVLASCSIKKWKKKWEELPWWQYYLHQQNAMVSTLNVLLSTLNKALPGGRPRITRFMLMPISRWIKFNHASVLPLSVLACSSLNAFDASHIHRHSKSSMVLGLKCLLQSNWHGVKFDWCSRVNTCIDIGCIYGLTPAGKSNPIGRVSELNSHGKVRQGFGLMLHNILMLMQSWFSLAWVSIMVRLNFSFNKF